MVSNINNVKVSTVTPAWTTFATDYKLSFWHVIKKSMLLKIKLFEALQPALSIASATKIS